MIVAMASGVLLFSCSPKPTGGQQVMVEINGKALDAYWLYLPRHYDPSKKWPVILFLQGGAVVNPSPESVSNDGPVKFAKIDVAAGKKQSIVADSFIIVNPHMRIMPETRRQWYHQSDELDAFIRSIVSKYGGDPSRVYLTGLSMGGHGSWGFAKKYPETFAAMAPIAGRISCKTNCEKLKSLPIWLFHNDGDPQVTYDYAVKASDYFENEMGIPFTQTIDFPSNKQALGSDRMFTTFKSDSHDAWNKTYRSPLLYEWFLMRKRTGN